MKANLYLREYAIDSLPIYYCHAQRRISHTIIQAVKRLDIIFNLIERILIGKGGLTETATRRNYHHPSSPQCFLTPPLRLYQLILKQLFLRFIDSLKKKNTRRVFLI